MTTDSSTPPAWLSALMKGVSARFGRGQPSDWKNRDFEQLSFEIRKQTGVYISPATLKRIAGKTATPNAYHPQNATIEALTRYAGIQDDSGDKEPPESVALESEHIPVRRRAGVAMLMVLILIVTGFVVFYQFDRHAPHRAKLRLLHLEGNNPSTALFEYHLPPSADSVFINYDDGFRPEYLSPEKNRISRYFQYPGVFHVRLVCRGKVISDTITVVVHTRGWQALASYLGQEYKDRFFPIPLTVCDTSMLFACSRVRMGGLGIDTGRIVVLRLDKVDFIGVSGDNFIFDAVLRNTVYWPAIRCNSLEIIIWGSRGKIAIKFVNPGCSHWLYCRLSEKHLESADTNLSMFARDLSEWSHLRIANRRQNIQISADDKILYTDTYMRSIGSLEGVSFVFHGNGAVQQCSIKQAEE